MFESLFAGLLAFALVMLVMPKWIGRARKKGITGRDMNKRDKPKVAEAGGIIVYLAFLSGLVLLIISSFILGNTGNLTIYLVSFISLSLIVYIAYRDDISGWKKGFVRWKKPLITIIAVLPVIPFVLGRNSFQVLYRVIELPHLFYPLLLVPVGFIVATNAVNLLGGFNGLEAGLGMVSVSGLLWFTWGTPFFSLLLVAWFSLLGFLWFNHYPSRVFPGDSLTYFLGGLFALVAVMGFFQTVTVLIMLPYILEGIIKTREIHYIYKNKSVFKPECFGKVQKDGSLVEPYPQIWSLTHVFIKMIRKIKGKAYENDVTALMLGTHTLWVLLVIMVFG